MKKLLVLFLLFAVLLTLGVVLAAPDNPHIPWWTVDGGGAGLSGGSYTLQGTTGQADAGGMNNGRYALNGGYWNSTTGNGTHTVYLPVVLNP
jgi:hypothetical protein